MKTKTYTAHIYPLFQANGYGATLSRNGKRIFANNFADKKEAFKAVETCAKNNGGTRISYIEEGAWLAPSRYIVKI